MILRPILVLMLLAVAGFGTWEVRRWRTSAWRDLISPRQHRLRAWGLFLLLLTLALWLGGTWLPNPPRHPRTRPEREAALRYIGYWTVTAFCAVPLVPLALLDTRENLRRLSRERMQLSRERSQFAREILPPGDDEV
jgi:hypothetical protein